jgi:hypothetical protein
MFEHEAHEDVVERVGSKWQVEDVSSLERDVRQARSACRPSGCSEGPFGRIDGHERRARTPAREGDRLRANAASRFEDAASSRERGVVVQELDESAGLIPQTLTRPLMMSVNVSPSHADSLLTERSSIARVRLS